MTEQVFAPIKILWVQNTVTYNVGTFFKMSLFSNNGKLYLHRETLLQIVVALTK